MHTEHDLRATEQRNPRTVDIDLRPSAVTSIEAILAEEASAITAATGGRSGTRGGGRARVRPHERWRARALLRRRRVRSARRARRDRGDADLRRPARDSSRRTSPAAATRSWTPALDFEDAEQLGTTTRRRSTGVTSWSASPHRARRRTWPVRSGAGPGGRRAHGPRHVQSGRPARVAGRPGDRRRHRARGDHRARRG